MDGQYFRKAIAAVLFLGVCAYCGAALGRLLGNGSRTAQACMVWVSDNIRAEGLAIRTEQPVCSDTDLFNAEDGFRLRAGTVLAQDGETFLRTETSSMYFDDCDGYEYLKPEMLQDLTVSSFCGILNCKPQPSHGTTGRLVSEHAWYFAALCPASAPFSVGDCCEIVFDGFTQSIPARVQYLSPSENGSCVMVFRLTRGGSQLMKLRFIGAEIMLSPQCGLRIPSAAVRSDSDGNTFVDIMLDGVHEPRQVDIIYTDPSGQWCLSSVSSREDALQEGDRILYSRDING